MRKITSFLMLALVISATCTAQSVRFGLTVSPQYAWMKSNNQDFQVDNMRITNTGGKLGFDYGLLLDVRVDNNERYAFSTGLIISHTGGNLKSETQDSTGTIIQTTDKSYKLQYIELPLTIRLRTNEIGYLTYFGQFGLNTGIPISTRGNIVANPDPNNISGTNLKFNDVTFINLALLMSAGIEYSLTGNTSLLVALYFKNGFANMVNDNDGERTVLNNLGLRIGMLF